MFQPVLFAAQSALHDSETQSTTERLVNMFPEQTPKKEAPVLLRSCPGRTQIIAGDGLPIRAMLESSTKLYYVANAQLWSFDGATKTLLGVVDDDVSTTIAENGTQVAVVANGRYFLYNGTTTVEVVGQAFTSFGSVDYMDGYFLFTEKDGQLHAVSALLDGTSLNALDFASAEYRPDNLVLGFVDHSEWWLFGESTTEVWSNQGLADYPFERVPGAQMERGCLQANTVAKLDNTMFWVGNDKIAYRAFEYTPKRISSHQVEASLRAATTISAFVYEYEGHKFYVLRLNGRPAWAYDAATNLWHERASGVDYGEWDVTAAARIGTTWYAGDKDGNISNFDRVFQENGSTLLRTAISRNLWLGGNRFTVSKGTIDVNAGTGGTVMFSYSIDRGRTWGNDRMLSVGASGDYDKQFSFNGFGMMRDFAVNLRMSDNKNFSINHAGVDVK